MYTKPGVYHQVLNMGPNLAVALNTEHEGFKVPDEYAFCGDILDCPALLEAADNGVESTILTRDMFHKQET